MACPGTGHRARRGGPGHDGIGADRLSRRSPIRTEDGPGADDHAVTDGGMRFRQPCLPPGSDAVIGRDVVADSAVSPITTPVAWSMGLREH